MTDPIFDILVAGEINPDLLLTGDVVPVFGQVEKIVDSAILLIGSSSVIFACAAARLGLKVGFVGMCGDDIFGKFMLAEISSRGVDIANVIVIPGGQTGLSVILNRGSDRAILTNAGLIPALKTEDVTPDLLCQARHLHVASYFLQTSLQPGLPGLFEQAHSMGLTTSIDTNWDPSGNWHGLETLLRQVDVFLPNENEALAVSEADDIDTAILFLIGLSKLVAVKQGGKGATACSGGSLVHAPAILVDVVDTVGAGDAFDAGFLLGFLKKWPLEKTLRLAVACGSLSTRKAGGIAGQPSLEEAMRHVSSAG